MLGHSDEYRLLIGRRVDGRHAVSTCWETVRNIRREDTVNRRCPNTLEERERVRVRRGRLVEGVQLLNSNSSVTNDVPSRVHLLRRAVVVFLLVDKVASLKVADGHRDREIGVSLDGSEVYRESELQGWHVCHRCNDTHRCRVA